MDPQALKNMQSDILTLQGSVKTLEQQTHNGTDSLQVDQKNLANNRYYGLFKKVTLTSTQITALHTTAQTLVPAGGVNTVIIVDAIAAKLAFNTAAYTGSNPLAFTYTNAGGTAVTATMSSTFLNSSSTAYDSVRGVVTEITPAANAPIVVSVGTANPAAGNSPITFIINYRVLTF